MDPFKDWPTLTNQQKFELLKELLSKALGVKPADEPKPSPYPFWSATQATDQIEGEVYEVLENGYLRVNRKRGKEVMKEEWYAQEYPEQADAYFKSREAKPHKPIKDE